MVFVPRNCLVVVFCSIFHLSACKHAVTRLCGRLVLPARLLSAPTSHSSDLSFRSHSLRSSSTLFFVASSDYFLIDTVSVFFVVIVSISLSRIVPKPETKLVSVPCETEPWILRDEYLKKKKLDIWHNGFDYDRRKRVPSVLLQSILILVYRSPLCHVPYLFPLLVRFFTRDRIRCLSPRSVTIPPEGSFAWSSTTQAGIRGAYQAEVSWPNRDSLAL